jgi:hypothetical protein
VTRVALAALSATLALCAAGCGGGSTDAAPTQDPGAFLREVVRERATGEYGRAWDALHPSHKLAVSRRRYVLCELLTPLPGRLESIRVLGVKDEPVVIAGQHDSTPSKAVTLRVSVQVPFFTKRVKVTTTSHAVAVHGHWTWLLTRDNFETYRAKGCPGTTPQQPAL